jgi:phosphoglycerate dehydrogenase-like enzyme
VSGREPLRVLWRAAPPSGSPPTVPGAVIRVEEDVEAAAAHADWADVLIDGRASALLDGARLRRVVVPWAGLSPGLRAALLERPHLRAHNSHYNAAFVAEHMVAMLLALAHRLHACDEALRRGDWGDRDRPLRSRHLGGRHALLLGYGRIGRAAVPALHGLGLTLSALRRRPPVPGGAGSSVGADGTGSPGTVREIGMDELRSTLPSVDVVLCSLPGTPATTGLMGTAALAGLPPGALVVNVGRAAVFDEDALYEALHGGHLGGAALDVWYRYPEGEEAARDTLPATRPFWELPHVLMSPHRADASDGSEAARVHDVCATIAALARGEERSRLDVDAGY